MPDQPTIYIIIVHFNNFNDLKACVRSVMRSDYPSWKVIIADNASGKTTRKDLLEWGREVNASLTESRFSSHPQSWNRINIFMLKENKGYGGAVNLVIEGLKQANPEDQVLILNPDIVLEPETLAHLSGCHMPGTITGAEVWAPGRTELAYLGGFKVSNLTGTVQFIRNEYQLSQLDAISGGMLFTSLQVFRDTGLWREDYFLYWEDAEWCRRAISLGYKLEVCPKATCTDMGSTTIGKGYLAEYFYTYNALKYVQDIADYFVITTLVSNLLRAAKRLLQFRFSNFRAILKASFDFITARRANADRLLRKHQ